MSKEKSEQYKMEFVQFLRNDGYPVLHDAWDDQSDTWDVHFKQEGRTLLAIFDGDDAEFIRIIFPNFYSLDNPEEQAKAYMCTQEANRICKGAKIFTNSDHNNVIATCEFLATEGRKDYGRYLDMIGNIAQTFAKKMGE